VTEWVALLRGVNVGGISIRSVDLRELLTRMGLEDVRTFLASGNAAFRSYRVPKFGDIPRTEVLFAEGYDELGPLGAKSMSEAPYNPVAPALANAVRDAIGVRPMELPMSRDRLWRLLNQ